MEALEFQPLTENEKKAAAEFVLIYTTGKNNKPVSVLVRKIYNKYIETILKYRENDGVAGSNKYLFGRGENNYYDGNYIIRRYANQCGAKDPQNLRGSKLRKHLATSVQYLKADPQAMRQITSHMSHTLETHETHYTKHLDVQHLCSTTTDLMALNRKKGLSTLKGKKLSDLHFIQYFYRRKW